MSGVQWNALAQAPNPGVAFTQSFDAARQRKQQEELQRIQVQGQQEDRQLQRETREQQQRAEQLRQARENLTAGLQLLGSARDENSYQQNIALARRMGMDVSSAPPNFDPRWVQTTAQQMQALKGQVDRELTVIDGVAFDKATGQPVFESPYDKIIPGPDGSFYRVPRHGYGRGGQSPQQQGEVVNGELPPGWSYDDEGGSGGNAGGNFPGGIDPLAPL